jgi:hypothetical protein
MPPVRVAGAAHLVGVPPGVWIGAGAAVGAVSEQRRPLLAEVNQRWAAELLEQRRADEAAARVVRCRRCGALSGAPCRTWQGRTTRAHIGRVLAARGGAR